MAGTTQTFGYTGAVQNFTVPTGVTSIQVALTGAGAAAGGAGDKVTGTLAVTPGDVLNLYVGGQGGAPSGGAGGAGGFNGGGNGGGSGIANDGGYGGAGASDIRRGGTALANRLCVAAGGGGSGRGTGGAGGNANANGGNGSIANGGGKAGTGAAGGAGGTGAPNGSAGASGVGGAGSTSSATGGGGGGGGGYFGGGGGGNGNNVTGNATGGGGGGSNYTGVLTGSAVTAAVGTANGSIVLTYDQPPSAPTLNTPAAGYYIDPTLPLTFSWTFADPDTGDVQAAVSLQYRIVGAGAWTDLLLIASSYTTGSYTAAAGTFVAGNTYEWRVAASDGTVTGPYSASSQFTASAPPAAPVITAPISQVTANPATVQWTTPGAQVAYQIRFVGDDGSGNAVTTTIYSDTGQVNAAGQSVAVGLGTALNGGTLHIQVRHQQNPGLWSPWADSGAETINVGQPGVPTLAFASSAASGSITVTVTNPAGPNPTVSQDLYRTDVYGVDLRLDASALAAMPAAADTLQPLQVVGQSLKLQAGSLAMNYIGAGLVRTDAQFQMDRRINRMRAEFLIESSTWTTDGALLGLFALVTPYAGAGTPDSHCYLTVGRTSWGLAYISGGGTLTSLISGSYAALPLDTPLAVEVGINPYTNTATVWLPDGSVKTVTNAALAAISGVVADAMIQLAAANTDRRPRLLNLWATGQLDFGELRIKAGMAPNSSYIDYTAPSGRPVRYRAQAYAFYGGTASSA